RRRSSGPRPGRAQARSPGADRRPARGGDDRPSGARVDPGWLTNGAGDMKRGEIRPARPLGEGHAAREARPEPRVVSLQVSRVREHDWPTLGPSDRRPWRTGYFKQPVAVPTWLGRLRLD